MKRLLVPLFLLLFLSSYGCEECGPQPPCRYVLDWGMTTHSFVLSGDVRIIPQGSKEIPDIWVYLIRDGEIGCQDLYVRWVGKKNSYCCGEWHSVEKGESFTVKFTRRTDYKNLLFIRYDNPCEQYRTADPFPSWRRDFR